MAQWKRVLSMIFAVVLTVQMLPMAVFAESGETEAEQTIETVQETEPETVTVEEPDGETMPVEPEESTRETEETAPTESEEAETTEPEETEEGTLPAADEEPSEAPEKLAPTEPEQEEPAEEKIAEAEPEKKGTEDSIIASGTCGADGDNLTWTLNDEGTLTISGTGYMAYYDYNNMPWYSRRTSIKAVIINSGVASIASYAFYKCTELTIVTIGSGVTSIGEYAFYECTKLTSVTIPDSVTSINAYAFRECSGLTNVTIGSGVASIGNYAFFECTGLTSVTIPDSVTSIGGDAFRNCTGLTSVAIGSGVTTIGYQAFYGCSGLTSIMIPDSVTYISENAFSYCTGLTSVAIGSGVSTIGNNAFSYCTGVRAIHFYGEMPNVYSTAFYGVKAFAFYPANQTTYSGLSSGSFGGNLLWIPEGSPTSVVAEGSCGENVTWTLTQNGRLTIRGTGAMKDGSLPLDMYKMGIQSILIGDGVTSIGNYAFSGIDGLTSINIPASVERIGTYAFGSCPRLAEVTIPATVTNVCDLAFDSCKNLTRIRLEGKPSSFGKNVFFNDTAEVMCRVEDGWREVDWASLGGTLSVVYDYGAPASMSSETEFLRCKNGENVALEDVSVRLTYQNGYSCTVRANEIPGMTAVHPDTSTAGVKELKLQFNGLEAAVPVYVHGQEGIELTDLPESEHPYSPNAFETYSVHQDGAERLILVFSDETYLAGSADLTVLDGNNTAIKGFSGSEAAGATVIVPGDTANLELVGDGTSSGYGFRLISVTAELPKHDFAPGEKAPTCTEAGYIGQVCQLCGKVSADTVLPATGHHFAAGTCIYCQTSQNAKEVESAHPYANNTDFSWTIHWDGASSITLRFSYDTQLETSWDKIYIYDQAGSKIGTYSGSALRGKTINVTGSTAVIRLTSDDSTTAYGFYVTAVPDFAGTIQVHTAATDAAVPATCTETGLTEGSHCSVCSEILVSQKIVDALGHDFGEWTQMKTSTCTEKGTEKRICSRCNAFETRDVDAKGHTEVIDPAVPATYISAGLTTGSHCSVCGTVLTAQQTIPMLSRSAPTITTSKNYGTGILVEWNAVKGASGYVIYRRAMKAGTTEWTTFARWNNTTDTKFLDTKAYEGTKYQYGIKAYYGNDPTTTTQLGPVGPMSTALVYAKKPAAPTATATVNATGGISVSWPEVKGAAGYVIYRRAWSSTTNGWTTFERWNNTTGLSFTDTKVYAGTIYQYGIKAYYGSDPKNMACVGEVGPLSTMVRITQRTISSIVSTGNNAITVKWDASSLFTGYQVQYSNDSAFSSKQTVTVSDKSKASSVIKVTKGGDFYFRVRSYTVHNGATYYGLWSAVKSISILSAPTGLYASKVSTEANRVFFTGITGASGYAVYRGTSASGVYTKLGTTSRENYTDNTAKSGVTYYYKVAAYKTSDGGTEYGLLSSAASITTALAPDFSAHLTYISKDYHSYCGLYIDNHGPKELYAGGSGITDICLVYPYLNAEYSDGHFDATVWGPGVSGYVNVALDEKRFFTDGAHIAFFFSYDECSYSAVAYDDGLCVYRPRS